MTKITLVVILLSTFAIGGTNHNPAEYTVTVHLTASRMVVHHTYFQQLSAVIDGKKYELESEMGVYGVLTLGDYKARLVNTRHKSDYEVWQIYELLLPDNKTRRFIVMEIKP